MSPESILKRLMKNEVLKATKCNVTFLADEVPELKFAGSWESVLETSISPAFL